jgi:LuxR family transcriptional regulator, maltose regulon positive regulatory protein
MLTTPASRDLLVSTKVNPPPLRAGRIARAELIGRIDAAQTKLTLLVAPAGFGKTTLLTQWVRQRDESVAWLSLSSDDSILPTFVDYLMAAIGTVDRDLVEATRRRTAATESADARSVFSALMSELSTSTASWTLILDDYHVIANDEIDQWVGQLIEYTPPGCRIVIASRTEPALRLARLYVRQELTRLDADDLRVTAAEVPELLVRYGIEASPSECLALNEHTNGWLAALHLAAINATEYSLESVIESLRDFSGDVHMLSDYLLQEVLNQQHVEMREFLLRSSILDRFTVSTCRAVTRYRRASELLELAVRRNLFVVQLDKDGGWYQYHRLFGDFLRRRLEVEAQPGLVASLNQAASTWFEQQGLIGEAISYSTRSSDWPRASAMISGLATKLLVQQREGDLLAWLESFPPAALHAEPNLSSISAYALARRGYPSEAARLIGAAEQRWQAAGHTNGLAAVSFVRGAMARFREDDAGLIANGVDSISKATGEPAADLAGHLSGITPRLLRLDDTWLGRIDQMLSYAHIAMGLRLQGRVDEAAELYGGIEDAFVASGVAFADTYYTPEAGSIRLAQGRLRQAEDLCRSFLRQGTRGLASERMYACALLAEVLREWNRLAEAEELIREGIDLSGRFETPVVLPLLYGALARTKLSKGKTTAALEAIDLLSNAATTVQNTRQARNAAALRVRIALASGELESARRWMAARGSDAANTPERATVQELLVYARSLIAHSEADDALSLLTRMTEYAERDGRGYDLVQIEVLRSLAYLDLFEIDRATAVLQRALELAEPEGYVRVFLDEGLPMYRLLTIAQDRGVQADSIERILSAAGQEFVDLDRAVRPEPVRPITEHEIDLLRRLSVGLTLVELGNALSLPLDTVKRELSRLYEKLRVASRTEAVDMARKLGLVPTGVIAGTSMAGEIAE